MPDTHCRRVTASRIRHAEVVRCTAYGLAKRQACDTIEATHRVERHRHDAVADGQRRIDADIRERSWRRVRSVDGDRGIRKPDRE